MSDRAVQSDQDVQKKREEEGTSLQARLEGRDKVGVSVHPLDARPDQPVFPEPLHAGTTELLLDESMGQPIQDGVGSVDADEDSKDAKEANAAPPKRETHGRRA